MFRAVVVCLFSRWAFSANMLGTLFERCCERSFEETIQLDEDVRSPRVRTWTINGGNPPTSSPVHYT